MGAETSDCDTPLSLINATFKWIDDNLKDTIDFVIWTGDSARHDNDENIPRTEKQVLNLNRMMVQKFLEVFGTKEDPTKDTIIPVIPTFGNNDILPHNILAAGPNKWTKMYANIWKDFIPEEQRHGFERGGWFYTEVIPDKLAVFSLNTLYLFDNNAGVNGCADKKEPGYEHMEWLRIQLQMLRKRGVKAIMMGHVPPARTESKYSWDETCWQKYTLWMHQYRDVVVGSIYGHMNFDHFMLQDSHDINIAVIKEGSQDTMRTAMDDKLTVQSSTEYLSELRSEWSHLPKPQLKPVPKAIRNADFHCGNVDMERIVNNKRKKEKKRRKGGNDNKENFFKKIGGPWGERYSLSLVSPSVVPNYFPALRVVEYNITGLDGSRADTVLELEPLAPADETHPDKDAESLSPDDIEFSKKHKGKKKKKKHKKHKRPKKPKFRIPNPPSASSPPGPAYSPQTLSFLGYIQYYANLTEINRDFTPEESTWSGLDDAIETKGWKGGKHHGKHPEDKDPEAPAEDFKYQIEYDTRNDTIYEMPDLTVRSYIDLAGRIGRYKPGKGPDVLSAFSITDNEEDREEVEDEIEEEVINEISYQDAAGSDTQSQKNIATTTITPNAKPNPYTKGENHKTKKKKSKKNKNKKKKKKKKNHHHHNRRVINQLWFTFVKRAFVGAIDDKELHDLFGQPRCKEGLSGGDTATTVAAATAGTSVLEKEGESDEEL